MGSQIGGQAFQSGGKIAVVVAEKDTHRLEVAVPGGEKQYVASTIISVGAQLGRPSASEPLATAKA
jgi:ribosomal protein L2